MIDKTGTVIILAGTLCGLSGFLCGQHTSAQEAHVNPQVVFRVDHEERPGRYTVEPTEARIAYSIEPIEGDNPAPFSPNDFLICRPYNEGPQYYLRCGRTRYAVKAISLLPKKEPKE